MIKPYPKHISYRNNLRVSSLFLEQLALYYTTVPAPGSPWGLAISALAFAYCNRIRDGSKLLGYAEDVARTLIYPWKDCSPSAIQLFLWYSALEL